MPDEATQADSLRVFLTGAGSDGGAQADPDAALGGYRSATEMQSIGWLPVNRITNVTVDHVSGACGTGLAIIAAATADKLAFKAPGGSLGAAVTITNGQTKILEDGGDATKFVRVTRSSTADLVGAMTLDLVDRFGNAVGMGNVPSADASAGETYYRALMLRNVSSVALLGVTVWLAASGAVLGVEEPTASAIQTIADEHTAPAGVSFSTGTTRATGIVIGQLDAGALYGVWIRREIAASTDAAASVLTHLGLGFEVEDR